MAFYLALDGGGTKTQCWVAEDARVLAHAGTGTVKVMNVGEDVATARLQELVVEALQQAGVAPTEITRTVFGLAGSSSAMVREWGERVLGELVAGEVVICGDEEIALDTAYRDGPGILIIAGTGANAVGRCTDGTMVGAGGWGPVIGDEGAGNWIGMEAIRAGLRALDRGVPTCLLREVQTFWKLESLGELVALVNDASRPNFSELCELVARCAEEGDALAASVLERAGEELAGLVTLVASKMQAAGCEPTDVHRVAFTGSVLEKIPRVLRSFTEHLKAAIPQAVVAEQAVDSLEGALWRARRG